MSNIKTVGQLIDRLNKLPREAYVNIYFSAKNLEVTKQFTEGEAPISDAIWFDIDDIEMFDFTKDGKLKAAVNTVMVQIYLEDSPSMA